MNAPHCIEHFDGDIIMELEFRCGKEWDDTEEELKKFTQLYFPLYAHRYNVFLGPIHEVLDDDLHPIYRMAVKYINSGRITGDVVDFVRDVQNVMVKFCNETNNAKNNPNWCLKPTCHLIDKNFFKIDKFVGANLCVNGYSLCFGNLINHSTFVPHQHLDKDHEFYGDLGIMKMYYQAADYSLRSRIKSDIMVDFEHDRRRCHVRFPYRVQNLDGSLTDAIVKLEIRYTSIRRLFANFPRTRETPIDDFLTLYFHLDSAPMVFVIKFERFTEKKAKVKVNPSRLLQSLGDRKRHWLHGRVKDIKPHLMQYVQSQYMRLTLFREDAETLLNILHRLYACIGKPIMFREINVYRKGPIKVKVHPSGIPENTQDISHPHNFPDRRNDYKFLGQLNHDYPTLYLIEALMSRGFHFKDMLLMDPEVITEFKNMILELHHRGKKLLLDTLEKLLTMVDEAMELDPILDMFELAIKKTERGFGLANEVDQSSMKQGYVRLRKVIITPARKILQAPEIIMGNRVLRSDFYSPDFFLRVSFRDENGGRVQSSLGSKLIEEFVKHSLMDELWIGGRIFNYFASSNSQMREQGCYFMAAPYDKIKQFRESLGRFELKSVPKLMARLGQCFTQSCKVGKALKRAEYDRTYDYIGPKNRKKEHYVYSDGNGCMSYQFAKDTSQFLNYEECVPCCFQSRFRGFKGIHVVNPNMDRLAIWAAENGIAKVNDPTDRFVDKHYQQLLFRESQEKFQTQQNAQHYYEVVKVSAPTPVCLNRPMINILDQVSSIQSYECHKRVVNRCFQLLDMQLNNIANSMIDEKAARTKLGEFPRIIQFDVLSNVNLTSEPFFRSMLRTSARCTLKKLREKMQIQIPPNMGRSMLGVVDETGQLQYGQIFAQYTVNIMNKRPGKGAAKQILKGPVLITKNPMVVAGDVRMFEAVDIPSLRHLVDVVVFPRWGPRPHPDEMAGSDLDGDEYSVIWDPGLYFERNEDAFDYTAPDVIPDPADETKLRLQMANFFVDYISQDSIGKIANSFLVKADMFGITSKVCNNIAIKNMEAVDFPKTGQAPSPLEKKEVDGVPAEVVTRYPDFMEKGHESTYESPRLNGRLFRRIKKIDHLLEAAIDEEKNSEIEVDPTFFIEGITEKHEEIAQRNFAAYQNAMELTLLQRFGVDSEVELFTNAYSAIRKRISDKEMDDMSFFNTQRIIEEQLEHLYCLQRKKFFLAFSPDQDSDEAVFQFLEPIKSQKELSARRRILKGRCVNISEDHKKLAVAYYRVAYRSANRRFLSFAWTCADVLYKVRQQCLLGMRQTDPDSMSRYFSHDPISDRLSAHIRQFSEVNHTAMTNFIDRMTEERPKNPRMRWVTTLIRAYLQVYEGLAEWMYFMYRWGKENGVISSHRAPNGNGANVFEPVHMVLLILKYGMAKLDQSISQFLEDQAGVAILVEDGETVNLHQQRGGIGAKFLGLMQFLSSRDFQIMKDLSFIDLNFTSGFFNGEWFFIQKVAQETFYKICLTNDLSALPHKHMMDVRIVRTRETADPEARVALDGVSFLIETFSEIGALNKPIRDALCEISGARECFIRLDPSLSDESRTNRLIVTVMGTVEAVAKMRKFLTPVAYLNSVLEDGVMAVSLASQIMKNINELVDEEERRLRDEDHSLYFDVPRSEDDQQPFEQEPVDIVRCTPSWS